MMTFQRLVLQALAMLVIAFGLTVSDVQAADPPANGEDAAAAHGESESVGMPQLDTSTFPSQIFWLVICFGTLLYLMHQKGIPRVAEILETRQERLDADLDRAAGLRAEAEEAARTYDEVVARAQLDAQAKIRETQNAVAADIAQRQASFDAETARKIHDAEDRIETAKGQALAEVAGVASEVVSVAVERLSGIKVSHDDASAAVSRILADGARG